ncbi:MAG: helix-turn-helix transcriptional regulator [Peptococcaceae bacterium]|nr:helix-turn-helix transcriptional regulator [Peptococcaceae bacterium]
MHKLTGFFKPYLAEILEQHRKKLKLTQGKMAERMAISARYYHDLKYAISMISVIEFIFVLKLLPDEEKLNLIHEVENLTESEAYKNYLDKIDFI